MFWHQHATRNLGSFYVGLAPTIYLVSLTIGIASTLLSGGPWPPAPPHSGQVTVDLLQSLGFLVALTALVFAVSSRVVSRWKDYSDTLDETSRVREKLDALQQTIQDEATNDDKEDAPTQKFFHRWVSSTVARFRKFVESTRTWYPWFLPVYGLIYVILRGQWLFSHTSFPSGENGTTLITVNVLVTISFLNNWMMVVICITERMIHVSRNLKRSTDLDLEDAKTALRRRQNN